MTTLLTVGSSSLLEDAGWQLLYSSVVACLVILLLKIYPKASPGLRLALWALVLVRLVVPPDLAAPWSARSLLDSGVQWMTSATLEVEGARPADEALALAASRFEPAASLDTTAVRPGWPQALLALWACCALICLGRLMLRRRRFHRLVAQAQPIEDARLRDLARIWRQRFGIRRPVRLVTSGEARTPFTLGVLRPKVFLPRAVLEFPQPGLVESVLAHELAHVKRFDDFMLLLCRGIECLYFFHPVVWIATRNINGSAEQLCDAAVLRKGSSISSQTYGRGLLAVLRLNLDSAEPMASFGNRSRSLEMRFRHILSGTLGASRGGAVRTLALTLLFGLFVLPLAELQATPPGPDDSSSDVESAPAETSEDMRQRLGERLRATAEGGAVGPSVPAADLGETRVVVLVNAKNPIDSISRTDLAKIFTKEETSWEAAWESGGDIDPVDLPSGSATRAAFSQAVHGKETREIMSFWQARIFAGQGIPPVQWQTEAEIIDFVGRKPGAIGYVDATTPLGPGVKAIEVTDP